MRTGSVDNGRRAIAAGEVVLGLDFGTLLGWCLLNSDGMRIDSGLWRMPPSTSHPGRRWMDLGLWLDQMLSCRAITMLAYEDVHRHHAKGRPNYRAAQVYGGILATALRAAWAAERSTQVGVGEPARRVACVGVPLTTAKARATKSGNARKDDMLEAARWRFGPSIDDHNEADACWVAWCALQGEGHAPGAGHARGGKKNPLAGRTIGC